MLSGQQATLLTSYGLANEHRHNRGTLNQISGRSRRSVDNRIDRVSHKGSDGNSGIGALPIPDAIPR